MSCVDNLQLIRIVFEGFWIWPFLSRAFQKALLKKINFDFYFHTSFWCLKMFYEGLKGFHNTFQGTTKKCENKSLS